MESNAECLKLRLAALAIVTSLLSACATVSSEPVDGVCPPVVEYSVEFQARAAKELQMLPDRSAVAQMIGDYAVWRELSRACE